MNVSDTDSPSTPADGVVDPPERRPGLIVWGTPAQLRFGATVWASLDQWGLAPVTGAVWGLISAIAAAFGVVNGNDAPTAVGIAVGANAGLPIACLLIAALGTWAGSMEVHTGSLRRSVSLDPVRVRVLGGTLAGLVLAAGIGTFALDAGSLLAWAARGLASSEGRGVGFGLQGLVALIGGSFWAWAALAATVTAGYAIGMILTGVFDGVWVSWIATSLWQVIALAPLGVAPWLPGGGFVRAAWDVFSFEDFEPLPVASAFIWFAVVFIGVQLWFQDRDLL